MAEARQGLGAGLLVGACAGMLTRELDLSTLVSYWGNRTALVPIVALLVAGLSQTRLRPWLFGATAALGLLWLGVVFTPVTSWLARDLVRRDAERSADVVFVLASRIQDDSDLTTEAMSRLVHGLELLAEHRAERLVLSELPEPHGRYATAARNLMRNFSLTQELITVGPVKSTHDEAVAVAGLCRARGWRRVLLVTSPTHSRRAAATFEGVGLEVVSSPSMETRFDLERLTRSDDRLGAFPSLVHEQVGSFVYRRRGWIN